LDGGYVLFATHIISYLEGWKGGRMEEVAKSSILPFLPFFQSYFNEVPYGCNSSPPSLRVDSLISGFTEKKI